MTSASYLLIDDIGPSLSLMTPWGRAAVGDAVDVLHDTVMAHAEKRGWMVVRHEEFSRWVIEQTGRSSVPCAILDPLFPRAEMLAPTHPLRISRLLDANAESVRDPSETESVDLAPGECDLVDDAAASGRTLRYAHDFLGRAGVAVRSVVLCASRAAARDAYCRYAPNSRWKQFVSGDWITFHLRDGFPYLPYAGRPTGHRAHVSGGARVEFRSSCARMKGHMWQVLHMNASIRTAVADIDTRVVRALEQEFGRPPRVADLERFATNSSAWVDFASSPDGETLLGDLSRPNSAP